MLSLCIMNVVIMLYVIIMYDECCHYVICYHYVVRITAKLLKLTNSMNHSAWAVMV